MKKYMMLLIICALVLFVATDVLAVDPFQKAMDRAVEAFKGSRALIFTIGGFALVGLGAAAIFGKIKWQWVGALAVGLGVLAVAGAVVEWAKDGGNLSNDPKLQSQYDYWK